MVSENQDLSAHWKEMIKESALVEYKKGQVIFYEGHVPFGVFIFVSGKVSLQTKSKDAAKAAPLNVPVGVDAFFDKTPYPYTAEAVTDVKAYFLGSSIIRKHASSKITS